MFINWLLYLSSVVLCLVFLFFYKQWIAWLTFIAVSLLPLLSLVLSLPAMLMARIHGDVPQSVTVGEPLCFRIGIKAPFPLSKWRLRIKVRNLLFGDDQILRADSVYPTQYCGALKCSTYKSKIYDYLGLFHFPLRKIDAFCVFIFPEPIEPANVPDTAQLTGNAWKPKPGGGYAENSELREYRPGDNLRQIHWKLSAKTGDLILREPMIPVEFRILLWFCHCGSPELLNRKLGNLLWLSKYLLHHGLVHDIMAFTDGESYVWHIDSETALEKVVMELLGIPASEPKHEVIPPETYHWQYYIGGDIHED